MALPMLLGFLGAGLAKSGALAGLGSLGTFLSNPLIASSVGAGLGRTLETGDLGEGVKAGFGSFLGGTALGAIGNAIGGGGAETLAGGRFPAGSTPVPPPPVRPGVDFSAYRTSPSFADVFKGGMNFGSSAQGLGAAMGSVLASPQKAAEPPKGEAPDLTKIKPMVRTLRTPPTGYRGGYDAEFDYGLSDPYTSEYFTRGYANGGLVRMQEGGLAAIMAQKKAETEIEPEDGEFEIEKSRTAGGNEKTVITDAIMAIKEMHPQPEIALATFVQTYGEDALRDLVDRVQSGEFDETVERFANGEKGEVRGPGDGSGTDDMVPATIDGEQDVLLSDGEFVVRKDSTDALEDEFGSGFMDRLNRAGSRAPQAVRDMVES